MTSSIRPERAALPVRSNPQNSSRPSDLPVFFSLFSSGCGRGAASGCGGAGTRPGIWGMSAPVRPRRRGVRGDCRFSDFWIDGAVSARALAFGMTHALPQCTDSDARWALRPSPGARKAHAHDKACLDRRRRSQSRRRSRGRPHGPRLPRHPRAIAGGGARAHRTTRNRRRRRRRHSHRFPDGRRLGRGALRARRPHRALRPRGRHDLVREHGHGDRGDSSRRVRLRRPSPSNPTISR